MMLLVLYVKMCILKINPHEGDGTEEDQSVGVGILAYEANIRVDGKG